MNDEDIIDLFFDRKESAIFETDNKYGNHLSKLAMRILNCHEDAEECKNDTYFETWNTVPPTRPTNFLAYLMRICRCDAFAPIPGRKQILRHILPLPSTATQLWEWIYPRAGTSLTEVR